MLLDKMAINRSDHLFVPVVFVFYLLLPLIQVESSDDYTDSRQFEKNLAVSRQRNNIQRLPNYNWKPEHYSLRQESTEKKARMEFTKPEDLEQRIADSRIKKMQEITRQKGEKWVPYKRNENEKLALDNVEEPTRANKLTNDESITQLDPTILMTLAPPSMNQNSANNFHDSPLLRSIDTNADVSNKKFDSWDMSIENPSIEIIQEPVVKPHQRHKDYEISDIKEDLIDKQNAALMDYERSELEENHSLTSKVNSHSKEVSQEFKTQHNPNNTRKNIKKYSNNDENLNYKNNSKESSEKEYPGQSNLSQNDKEESSKASKRHDEKTVTTKSLTRKVEKDDVEKKKTERLLNHRKSFHSLSRWGMSILSPPTEFLKDISRRSIHRKNEEHTEGEKDERYGDLDGRWGTNVALLPKEFREDISMHQAYGTEHLTVKPESRPSQVEGSANRRSLAHQNPQNSQADSTQRFIMGEHNKKLAETLHKEVSNNLYHFRYPKLNYQTNVDFKNNYLFLRKFLMQALQLYDEQKDVDMPMLCCVQIPYVLFRT